MAKIKLNIYNDLQLYYNNNWVDAVTLVGADNTIALAPGQTSLKFRLKAGNGCPNGSPCEYDMFEEGSIPEELLDMLYREYKLTYIDYNDCETEKRFKTCGTIFTRPIDDCTSDHPKPMSWSATSDSDTIFATSHESGFSGNCYGINNGLDKVCWSQFYEGTYTGDFDKNKLGEYTYTTPANWCWVNTVEPCSYTAFTAGTTAYLQLDITQNPNNGGDEANPSKSKLCKGFARWERTVNSSDPWVRTFYLANRTGAVQYSATTNNTGSIRCGRFEVNMTGSTVDAFTSWKTYLAAQHPGWSEEQLDLAAVNSGDVSGVPSEYIVHFTNRVYVYLIQYANTAPPSTYTFTVRSNVEGATVTWGGDGSGTATISGGKAVYSSTTANSVTATLSSPGVTFVGNPAVIGRNETKYVNKLGCAINGFSLSQSLNGNGGTGAAVGSWSTNGACSGNATLTYVSGDDFLTNVNVSSNGVIYASFVYNGTGRVKSGTYKLTIDGVSATATVKQSTGNPCVNVPAPSPGGEGANISHTYNTRSQHYVTFENDCWTAYSAEILSTNPVQDQGGIPHYISISQPTCNAGLCVQVIDCFGGHYGFKAVVRVHLRRNDGTTAYKDINVSWIP